MNSFCTIDKDQEIFNSNSKEVQTINVEKVEKYVQTISIESKDACIMHKTENVSVCVSCKLLQSATARLEKMSISEKKEKNNFNSTLDSVYINSIFGSSSELFSDETPDSTTTTSGEKILKQAYFKDLVYSNYTKVLIEDNPLIYLGIPKPSIYIIQMLTEATNISVENIYLTLKKLRLNLPYSVLGYEFGLSESQVGKVFRKTLKALALVLKKLIFWPTKKQILLNLPIAFRYRFKNVESIIDCFEIELEKPSDAYYQALTWSDYKKGNTAKYFVCITPDGLIIYISKGYGGRTSDMAIIEDCDFLKIIPLNSCVLADRGFKGLDAMLQKKGCKVFRPPSVQTGVKSSKEDVKLTKRIASTRIHVERAIERIRNFLFLNKNSCMNTKIVDCLDDAVVVAAALTNLQSEIIKQS